MTKLNPQSANITEVAIIGAGPYGLSIAAHLAALGVSFRIFGKPMSAWADQMPKGMRLKSEGFASSLADPTSRFTLGEYCRQQGLRYQDIGLPVPLETFVAYGRAFQKHFVAQLEEQFVTAVRRHRDGFELQLADGEIALAHKVVVAVGITHFAQLPAELASLPGELVSHSSAHSDLAKFSGRRVGVLGSGASALDLAGLLHRAGASAQVIARSSTIRFQQPPGPRSPVDRLLRPVTGIGGGMQLFFYCNAPQLFRMLPEKLRLDRVRKTLGPAPGWFVKEEVFDKVPIHLDMKLVGASSENGRVWLNVADRSGSRRSLEFDHVIAATGYRVDLERLRFLDRDLLVEVRLTECSPALSGNFESSVRGLYFVGVAAANTFGPMMRFAFGCHFTAPRISRHLARRLSTRSNAYAAPETELVRS
jgi:thioredoxin reductase